MLNLDTPLTITRFQTLASTAEAHLDGDAVCGRFAESLSPLVLTDAKRVCETFANWVATPEQVLRFTRKYAPLHLKAKPGQFFQFEVKEWVTYQKFFRTDWQMLAPPSALLTEMKRKGASKQVNLGRDSQLVFLPEGITFQTNALITLLDVCFGALPLERLRVCANPGCKRPYFVAHHLKQTFCGTESCIEWGKNKLKLEYWNRNKERLLAERKRRK